VSQLANQVRYNRHESTVQTRQQCSTSDHAAAIIKPALPTLLPVLITLHTHEHGYTNVHKLPHAHLLIRHRCVSQLADQMCYNSHQRTVQTGQCPCVCIAATGLLGRCLPHLQQQQQQQRRDLSSAELFVDVDLMMGMQARQCACVCVAATALIRGRLPHLQPFTKDPMQQ
jgi:hypothetical protein